MLRKATRSNRNRHAHAVRRLLVMVVTAMLFAAACSNDDTPSGEPGPTTTTDDTGGTEPEPPAEIDRSGRFSGLDSFCEPASEPPSETPQASAPGITETEISITHIRMKLEDLASIGFGVDIGDPNDTAATFVGLINDRCGGIHGRKLELNTIELPVIAGPGQDTSSIAQAACIEAAEDHESVFAWSTSGFGDVGVPCLTQAHDVVFVTSYTVSLEDIENAEGRLYASGLAGEESLTYMARDLARQGLLEGKKIGVVRPDSTPDAQIVEVGLVQVLKEELGLDVARVDTIGCGGSNSCTDGVAQSVQGMIADGVDVLFPNLNVISLPPYLAEMANQGVEPGDITMYQSGFLAQSGDLVSGKVVEFGDDVAGELYNGTTVIASAPTGEFRLPDYEPSEFSVMCNREYAENGNPDEEYRAEDEATNTKFGAVLGMCSSLRVLARALEDAGPNPSRDDLARAMEGLGAIDPEPNSFGPGKYTAPNTLYSMTFHFPCPYETENVSRSCIVVDGDAREQPREPLG